MEDNTSASDWAAQYRALGWVPVPLKGKVPTPGKGWQTMEEGNLIQLVHPDSNVGLILGRSGLLDVDVDDARVLPFLRLLPRTRLIIRRKRITHLLYRTFAEARTRKFGWPGNHLLEMRASDGSQTMVPPSVHPDGDRLTWANGLVEPGYADPEDLARRCSLVAACVLLTERMEEGQFHDAMLAVAGGLARGGIPLPLARNATESLVQASGQSGIEDRLSGLLRTYRLHEEGEPVAGWERLRELGWSDADVGFLHRRVPDLTRDHAEESDWDTGPDIDVGTPPLFIELEEWTLPDLTWSVEGIANQGELVHIFGAPEAGKSLVVQSLAAAYTRADEEWLGHPVRDPGAVVYFVGEGQHSVRERLQAMAAGRKHPLLVTPMPLLFKGDRWKVMAEQLRDRCPQGISALIVDTMIAHLNGSDSSEEDTQAFFTFINRLRQDIGARTTYIVHHVGHVEQDRGRGSSNIRAAFDTEWKVNRRAHGVHSMQCTKFRNGDREQMRPVPIRVGPNWVMGRETIAAMEEAMDWDERTWEVIDLVAEHDPVSRDQLTGLLGWDPRRTLERLVRDGTINAVREGRALFYTKAQVWDTGEDAELWD